LQQKITKLKRNEDSKSEICIDYEGVFKKHNETWTIKSISGECAECICKVRAQLLDCGKAHLLIKIILFSEISNILQDFKLYINKYFQCIRSPMK
jgi:hypothetical protein